MSLSLPSAGGGSVASREGTRRFAVGQIAVDRIDLFVVAATVIAALLRLPTLAAKGFWYDELISVNIAREPVGMILRARLKFDASPELIDLLYTNNPPLHLLLIHVTFWFSSNEAVIRLPFALAGIATIPVAFQVLLRLFGRTTAGLGAVLLAVSPLHIAYSQEARPTAFLVLFSLLSLLYLLRALDGEGNRIWVLFAVITAINCWTSYFALTLIVPTLAAVAMVKLAGSPRQPLPRNGWRALWKPALAFGAVVLAVLPLIPDLFMTAGRNQVEGSDSLARLVAVVPLALAALAGLLHPVPGSLLPLVPVLLPAVIGLWTLNRKPDRRAAIVAVWIVVPCLVLLLLSSSHGVSFRYLMPILPIAIALPVVGIDAFVTRLQQMVGANAARGLRLSLLALVFVSHLFGVRVYEQGFISTGPIKRDWRAVVERYVAAATPQSCLVLLDDLGLASYNEVPYYLNQTGSTACSIDVRDPRLLEVVSTHSDLWWGVAVPQADRGRLIAAFAGQMATERFTLLVLIRGGATDPGSTVADAESILNATIDALAPQAGDRDPSLAAREGLANLYALTGRPAESITPLIADAKTYWGENDVQQWDHAERWLERGDFAKARALGIRLVALYPGDPRAYDLLMEIDERSGGTAASAYRALAAALRQ